MAGKHRDSNLKVGAPYAVGTKLKLEKILGSKSKWSHFVSVSAKRGYASDVYLLYSDNPKEHIGNLVEIERTEPGFMRYIYYLRPAGDVKKIKPSFY